MAAEGVGGEQKQRKKLVLNQIKRVSPIKLTQTVIEIALMLNGLSKEGEG